MSKQRLDTTVASFSLPPTLLARIEMLAKRRYMNRSEFLREMLEYYTASTGSQPPGTSGQPASTGIQPTDMAGLLSTYWQSQQASLSRLVITGLGIMNDYAGNILIARRAADDTVEHLTWGFPGGALKSLDFAHDVRNHLLHRTGYETSVGRLVAARMFPDVTKPNTDVAVLYFACQMTAEDKSMMYDPRYRDVLWVKPLDAFRYFTSSVTDEVTAYLTALQADPLPAILPARRP